MSSKNPTDIPSSPTLLAPEEAYYLEKLEQNQNKERNNLSAEIQVKYWSTLMTTGGNFFANLLQNTREKFPLESKNHSDLSLINWLDQLKIQDPQAYQDLLASSQSDTSDTSGLVEALVDGLKTSGNEVSHRLKSIASNSQALVEGGLLGSGLGTGAHILQNGLNKPHDTLKTALKGGLAGASFSALPGTTTTAALFRIFTGSNKIALVAGGAALLAETSPTAFRSVGKVSQNMIKGLWAAAGAISHLPEMPFDGGERVRYYKQKVLGKDSLPESNPMYRMQQLFASMDRQEIPYLPEPPQKVTRTFLLGTPEEKLALNPLEVQSAVNYLTSNQALQVPPEDLQKLIEKRLSGAALNPKESVDYLFQSHYIKLTLAVKSDPRFDLEDMIKKSHQENLTQASSRKEVFNWENLSLPPIPAEELRAFNTENKKLPRKNGLQIVVQAYLFLAMASGGFFAVKSLLFGKKSPKNKKNAPTYEPKKIGSSHVDKLKKTMREKKLPAFFDAIVASNILAKETLDQIKPSFPRSLKTPGDEIHFAEAFQAFNEALIQGASLPELRKAFLNGATTWAAQDKKQNILTIAKFHQINDDLAAVGAIAYKKNFTPKSANLHSLDSNFPSELSRFSLIKMNSSRDNTDQQKTFQASTSQGETFTVTFHLDPTDHKASLTVEGLKDSPRKNFEISRLSLV